MLPRTYAIGSRVAHVARVGARRSVAAVTCAERSATWAPHTAAPTRAVAAACAPTRANWQPQQHSFHTHCAPFTASKETDERKDAEPPFEMSAADHNAGVAMAAAEAMQARLAAEEAAEQLAQLKAVCSELKEHTTNPALLEEVQAIQAAAATGDSLPQQPSALLQRHAQLMQRRGRLLAAHPEYHAVVMRQPSPEGAADPDETTNDSKSEASAPKEGAGGESNRDRVSFAVFEAGPGNMLYAFTDDAEASRFWESQPPEVSSMVSTVALSSPIMLATLEQTVDAAQDQLAGLVINPSGDAPVWLTTPEAKALAVLKRALVVERILRQIQYEHCSPFPSPMSPHSAESLVRVLDHTPFYVLTNADRESIVLAEHVHQDVGDDAAVPHNYICVFTAVDSLEAFVNESSIGSRASFREATGREVFGALKGIEDADGLLFNPVSTAALSDAALSAQMGMTTEVNILDKHPGSFKDGTFGYVDAFPYLCLIQRRHVFSDSDDSGETSGAPGSATTPSPPTTGESG